MKFIKSMHDCGSVTVIELKNAIDRHSVSEVQVEYAMATCGKVIHNVLFDLREVAHANTASLAALIDLVKYMKDNRIHGEVGLCNLSGEARALIDMTKVAELFQIYPNVETAVVELS